MVTKMFSQQRCYQTIEELEGVYRKQAKISGPPGAVFLWCETDMKLGIG